MVRANGPKINPAPAPLIGVGLPMVGSVLAARRYSAERLGRLGAGISAKQSFMRVQRIKTGFHRVGIWLRFIAVPAVVFLASGLYAYANGNLQDAKIHRPKRKGATGGA